jgi:L-iditol 2-dehydrogenase
VRALLYREPGHIEVTDVDEPKLPAGGVVISSAFAGVCGSDITSWRHGSQRLKGPQVLGHEVSGTIIESDAAQLPVGLEVTVCPGISCQRCEQCQAGGAIWCPNRRSLGYDFAGGMAERFAVPVEAVELGSVVRVPSGLSLRAASLAEPLHTVINGQDRADINSRDCVLVIGLGPIGTLHSAVARSRGAAPVIAIDVLEERVEAAASVLGSGGIRVSPGDARTVRGWAPRNGWDVVVVAAGVAPAMQLALDVVAPGGRVLAFAGMPADKASVPIDMNRVHYQQLRIIGAFGGNPEGFRRAVRWLAESRLPLDRFITTAVPLSDAVSAFELCERGVGLKTSIAVDA